MHHGWMIKGPTGKPDSVHLQSKLEEDGFNDGPEITEFALSLGYRVVKVIIQEVE